MSAPENIPMTSAPTGTPAPAVEALLKTLDAECAAVDQLTEALDRQLGALQTSDTEPLMDATDDASRIVGDLSRLRERRRRQTRLLARVLGTDEAEPESLLTALADRDAALADRLRDARHALRARIEAGQTRSDEVAFALHVAVHIGRELLQAGQHLDAPLPLPAYTAGGTRSDTAPARSFLNHLG